MDCSGKSDIGPMYLDMVGFGSMDLDTVGFDFSDIRYFDTGSFCLE